MRTQAEGREPGWTNARVLWSFLRPRRLALVAGIVLGLLITGATLATPLVLRNLLDGLTTGLSIGGWVALLVALLLVGAALSLVQEVLLGRLSEDVVLDARTSMVHRLLRVHMRELAHRPRLARAQELAQGAVGRMSGTLERFLAAVRPQVVSFCRAKLTGSAGVGTAEDVAQEVLLAVCKALPRYRGGVAVMTWVTGIARGKIVDAFRASRRSRSTPSPAVPDAVDPNPGPEFAAVRAPETDWLRLALARLPDSHRKVLVLRVALGYTAAEVAQAVGSTAGAVRLTQHRALNQLRAMLVESAPTTV